MKRNIFYRITGVLIISLVTIGLIAAINTYANQFRLWGRLVMPYAWSGSHAEKVWFYTGTLQPESGTDTLSGAYFNQNGDLYGFFWLGTAGWTTFSDGNQSFARIRCPGNMWENLEQICPVE